MAEVRLSDGRSVLVSDEDFEAVRTLTWRDSGVGYAMTSKRIGGGRRIHTMMHRLILGLHHGDGKVVDHINGNRLDNRRENLRICTMAENTRNQRRSKANTSGYKGVHRPKKNKKWIAKIRLNGKIIHLGSFDTAEAGYEAYCKAAKELHGDFARVE